MLHKNRVKNRTHMTSFRVIIISFFCLILVGSLLLMLPISSRQRCVTSFPDAMFTAVSATCVTGLVVKRILLHTGALFKQAVILVLVKSEYGHLSPSGLRSLEHQGGNRSVRRKYDAGIHLRTSGRRYCEADRLYP